MRNAVYAKVMHNVLINIPLYHIKINHFTVMIF